MRKLMAGVVAVLMVAGLSVGVSATPTSGEHRIILSESSAKQLGVSVRNPLGNGRVSAEVSDAQLSALQRRGISLERVPERFVDAAPDGKGKPGQGGSTGRTLPTTQVPYGVKMVYGNPGLTPAGVSGGAGVVVAVLDTGSVSHPDFVRADGSQVITQCVDFSQKKVNQVEGFCEDGDGHGTHVTGTVAAAGGLDGKGLFGVAPQASVYSYKVLNNQGRGYADDIARAIRVAADRGANIVSMSFGSYTPSQDELDAIRYAVSKGVLFVGAAGNEGPAADTIGYPGGFAEVVAVAALNPDEVVAYFSSRGISDGDDRVVSDREVEVAAPGRAVISTSNKLGYVSLSGTSMAAPHISGLAAKMWQGSASRTRTWLRQAAQMHDITAAESTNNAGMGYDVAGGYGLPQVQTLSQPMWNN